MKKRRNTKEASRYLKEKWGINRTPGTLEVLRSRGRGPGFIRVGRNILYTEPELDGYGSGVPVRTIQSVRE